MAISRRVVLHFPRTLVEEPIIYRLVRDYDLMFNILKASVTPNEQGLLVLELSGERENYEKGVRYLAEVGVQIQPLSREVTLNEARCTPHGACITICPTGAFALDLRRRP